MSRLSVLARRVPLDAWAMVAMAAAVVLAHLPYLLDFVDANPLGPRSGLLSGMAPGFLVGQPTIDPNNGFLSEAVSHRAALDWVHGRVPWWNPYQAAGTPLAGEMQSAALFPPTLLTLLGNGQLYERMLLEIVAGVSTFALLRRLGLNRWAGAAAGAAFALNGTFAWFAHATINPIAFLPLLLVGIERAYGATASGRRGGWGLIGLAAALSYYAGFPEVAYIDALLAVVWFAWRAGCVGRGRVRAFVQKGAAGALLGVLLAAPLLIASVEFVQRAYLGLHTGSSFTGLHLDIAALPQLLLPYVHGPIFGLADPRRMLTSIWGSTGGFVSSSLLLFALLGLLSPARLGLRLVLLGWVVVALARSYGVPVLGHLVDVLPKMGQVAFYRYAPASVELSIVILAALGLDDLIRRPASRRRAVTTCLVVLVAVIAAAVGARSLGRLVEPAAAHSHYYAASVAWAILIVLAVAAAALVRRERVRRLLLAVLLAGDALVLFAVPILSAPRAVETDLAPVAFLQQRLGQSRFFTLGPLQPNYGSYFGIASLNSNDVPLSTFAHYIRGNLDRFVNPTVFVGNLGGDRSLFAPSPSQELMRNIAGYRGAAVTYVLAPAGTALPQTRGGFTLVLRSPSTWIYRLAGAAPYFTAAGCTIRPHGREAADVLCSRRALLVRREASYPGWSAEVDGRSVPLRSAGLFQAVQLPSGSHVVTFDYRPRGIAWGYLAFAAGWAWLLLARLRRRHSPTRAATVESASAA